MAQKLPHKNVAIIGLGWTGSILAYEMASSGLDVIAIERGPWRDTASDFPPSTSPDELRYASRLDLFLRPAQDTVTFRNKMSETALPLRSFIGFLPGNGVGGAGLHWNGNLWRFLPTDFRLRSHLTQRYGASALPADMTIQDWPLSYDELEPYYDQFDKLCGTSGKAGNLKGAIQQGGNPFEGARSSEYPTPAMKQPYAATLFGKAAEGLGYHPFPQPSCNLSQAYTNSLGVKMGQCSYCGFCERFGCGNYSKSSPQTCVLPALMRLPNFTAMTDSEVLKINLDSTGKKATGVTFVDTSGQEWEQTADLVLVCAFSLFNVRLMLLSGIGTPYDPTTGKGVVGRNYSYQAFSAASIMMKKGTLLNPFIAAGSTGVVCDDFNGDNFDHSGLGFVGGSTVTAGQSNGRPISTRPVAPGTPKWGAAWKKATAEGYQRGYGLSGQGSSYSYKDCYLDLDPTYKDRFNRPLLRMTFDWHDNELKMSAYITEKLAGIAKAMDAEIVSPHPLSAPYTTQAYQSTHNTGGTVMGSDPSNSVLNRYCQSWDVPNVFIPGGASVFPQNVGYNPTGTVGALAYWTAAAIKNRYLKNPGRLI